MKLLIEFELGRLYSVPFADGVVTHGTLQEVKLRGDTLIFKIKTPAEGEIFKSIDLPSKL